MSNLREDEQIRLECLKIAEGNTVKAERMVSYVTGLSSRPSDVLLEVGRRLNKILQAFRSDGSRAVAFAIETRMRDALFELGLDRDVDLPDLAVHSYPGGVEVRVSKMHATGPHPVVKLNGSLNGVTMQGDVAVDGGKIVEAVLRHQAAQQSDHQA